MKQGTKVALLIILDFLLLNTSFAFSYLLKYDFSIKSVFFLYSKKTLIIILISVLLKILCLGISKLYNSLWRYAGTYEMLCIFSVVLITNMIFFSYNYGNQNIAKSIFIMLVFVDTFVIGGTRFTYRILRKMNKGELGRKKAKKKVMVVGAGDAGAMIIREISMQPHLESRVVTIVDDDPKKLGKEINGIPIEGNRDNIEQLVKKKRVNEILLALPSANSKQINDIYSICSRTKCKIKILPSVAQLIDESVITQKIREVKLEDLLGREPIKLDNKEVSRYIAGKIVLVTGGGGSIGSELCRQIAGYMPKLLLILDNYENNAYEIQNELLSKYDRLRLQVVIANIRERERLEEVFKIYKPNIVFHAAAHKHVPLMEENPVEAVKNNVFGTYNVAECANKFRAEKFVFISTDKSVNPTNIMGATKRMAEKVIQAFNTVSKTEYVAVRFGNVLGSNGSVIPVFKKQIESGGPVTVTHPEVTRFFMTIPEAVQLVLEAGGLAKGGEIFILDMGRPVKIIDLAKNLIKLSGLEPDKDIDIEITGLRPGEKLYEELLLNEEGLLKTANDKIFIARPVLSDFAFINRELEILRDVINKNSEDIISYMKVIVPTYKSAENTGYVDLDKLKVKVI